MEAQPTKSAEARWNDEAAFFDGTAHKIDVQPLDPATLQRYSGRVRRRFSPEYRLRVVNPLAGKKVLEIGCGDGHTSVLLARRGANVTGIAISPKLVDIAKRRSKINEVDDRCQFLCGPIETADLPENSFDIIWGDAILHHLIPELPSVLPKLTRLAKPNSILIFAEPVNFCQVLRRIRFLIPVKVEATPDERPLEKREIEIMRQYIHDLRLRHFSFFGRLNGFVLVNHNYERSSAVRRAISNVFATLDWFLLSLPGVRRLGGVALIYGHPGK